MDYMHSGKTRYVHTKPLFYVGTEMNKKHNTIHILCCSKHTHLSGSKQSTNLRQLTDAASSRQRHKKKRYTI